MSWVSHRSIGQNKGYQRRDRLGEDGHVIEKPELEP